METKWLEDFLVLAENGSFTRSADIRHLTQSAFSRRIKQLESWLGTDLIDRTSYPTQLTAAGEAFKDQAISLLSQLQSSRALLQGMRPLSEDTIEFAVPHTLSFNFFPEWLCQIESDFGELACRLQASNVHDAVLAFVEGGCDILMCYHHPKQPVALTDPRYAGLKLGIETLRPYAATTHDEPKFRLPGKVTAPIPFLGYAPHAYFKLMTELFFDQLSGQPYINLRYETDMAEGLKYMAIQGHGVAILPESSVKHEVENQQLMLANPIDQDISVEMAVHVYRDVRRRRPALDALWHYLSLHYEHV